ncbi:MAG: YeeE/YedE family protein [Rhodospirillales bacterium]|nr:YeeE/YedE family protein [Rhodospirillales bacterium]
MAREAAALVAGIVFGLGLAISEMVNPAKVIGFLDLAGAWDPSLAFVMAVAVPVAAVAYRLMRGRAAPLWDGAFHLPARRAIDGRLLAGAAVFGIGWGMAGLCPGPAIAALVSGDGRVVAFVAAMAAGAAVVRWFGGARTPAPGSRRSDR